MVISEYRGATIKATLVRRDNVAQRRAVIKNIVPRQRKTVTFRPVLQKQIGHQPRAILELGDVARGIVSIRPQQIACKKMGRREDNLLGVEPDRGRILGGDGDYIDTGGLGGIYVGGRQAEPDVG